MDFQAQNNPLPPEMPKVSKDKQKIIENILQQGKTCEETSKLVKVRKDTVVKIRQNLESEGKLEVNAWKKEMTSILGEFALKGAKRLNEEAENMNLSQLMMAVAISIDKVRDLSDVPTIKVETRLKITQDELKDAFSASGEKVDIIDIEPNKPLDQGS